MSAEGSSAKDHPGGTPNSRPKAKRSAVGSGARVRCEPRNGGPSVTHRSITHHDSQPGFAEPDPALTSEPMPIASTMVQMDHSMEFSQIPPSPPLTATSSMSRAGSFVPRVFDCLTQDRWGSRTFFVACQGSGAIEYYIKVRKALQIRDNRLTVGKWWDAG